MDQDHLFLNAAIAASVALTQVARADDPYPTLEARVRAVAERGPDALRQFVFRTRMIYALSVYDFAVPEPDDGDEDPGPQGFWAGVPGYEAEQASWLEAAARPAADHPMGRD